MHDRFTPEVRLWIYRVIAAAVPLLVTLGIITDEVGGHIMAVGASILALGGSLLAAANVSTTPLEEIEVDNVDY